MSRFISNIFPYITGYPKYCINVSDYNMTETDGVRPGYGMNKVHKYLWSVGCTRAAATPGCGYRDIDNWTHEVIETEKEFDRLSIVKPGQTLTSWVINVRIPLQELWIKKNKLSSCMAICFHCWKLVKINDKRGRIKAEDLLTDHWNHSCMIPLTKDGCARIIQKAYRNYREKPTSYCKRVWEVVRNDDTPKEKKFLGMPYHGKKMIMYSIFWNLALRSHPVVQGCSFTENTEDSFIKQLYNQKSYSEHKRDQLCERLRQVWEKLKYMKEINVVTLKSRNIILTPKYYEYNRVRALGDAYFNSM
ncbi:hypothetical protein C1646_770394 [Rhizophagus diaphanus]|nr:hypothetical protein C1646_770394 [Rhizophagus diaphanus] [Rhizophagus sp. MUCL 43196]